MPSISCVSTFKLMFWECSISFSWTSRDVLLRSSSWRAFFPFSFAYAALSLSQSAFVAAFDSRLLIEKSSSHFSSSNSSRIWHSLSVSLSSCSSVLRYSLYFWKASAGK